MIRKILLTVSVALLIACLACQHNVIDLEIDELPPKLVVSGLFDTDSAIAIGVMKTEHILVSTSRKDKFDITNATVELYENNVFKTKMHYQLLFPKVTREFINGEYVTEDGFTASEGNTYSIKVTAPGYEPVLSSTTVPSKVPIVDFKIDNTPVPVNGLAGHLFNVMMTFQDPPDEENFYSIEILRIWSDELEGTVSFNLELYPRLNESNSFMHLSEINLKELYLTDKSFDGQLHTYNFLIPYPAWASRIEVFLKHITKEHYEYGKSTQMQQQETSENPFSQPVQVRTNIENGMGIFSCSNVSVKIIEEGEFVLPD